MGLTLTLTSPVEVPSVSLEVVLRASSPEARRGP